MTPRRYQQPREWVLQLCKLHAVAPVPGVIAVHSLHVQLQQVEAGPLNFRRGLAAVVKLDRIIARDRKFRRKFVS